MADNVISIIDLLRERTASASVPPALVTSILLDLKHSLSGVDDLLKAAAVMQQVPGDLPRLDAALEELVVSLRELEQAAAIASAVQEMEASKQ